jgi:hypothetical protein
MNYHHKIKCPRHFMLKPGADPFQLEIDPKMRHVPDWAYTKWPTLKKYRYKKDKHGNKIYNPKSYYQPNVTAGFAIEHVFDPLNPICRDQCRMRCAEGSGGINQKAIKRLVG